jgi:mono/diheme cytochrome c family protein
MKRKRKIVDSATGLVLATTMVLSACGAAPATGSHIPKQDPDLVTEGGPLYAASCAECHGEDLRGTNKGPSHLSIVYEPGHHSDFAFDRAVKVGTPQHHWPYGPMEPVAGLSDRQIEAIIAYVREAQRIEGFEAYPPT